MWLVQARLSPCLSRLRQKCFEIAVDNIAYREESECFAWYEHSDSESAAASSAGSAVADGMLLLIQLSLSQLFRFPLVFHFIQKKF